MNNSSGLYNSDESNQHSGVEDGGGFSLRNVVVDELGRDLKKSLRIDSGDNRKRNVYYEEEEEEEEDEEEEEEDEDEEEEDGDITEALLVQMGYAETRPATPQIEEVEEEEDLLNQMGYGKTEPPKHEPPATPIPADNLKSAMKGNRKKGELPVKERKVTWANDVYDPIPSAPSRFATNRPSIENKKKSEKKKKKRQKCDGKGPSVGGKYGKDKDRDGGKGKMNKQGGGGAKNGKGKDKKKAQKFSGSSSRKCFDTLDGDVTG